MRLGPEVLWLVLASITGFYGCLLLAMSQNRNWKNVHGESRIQHKKKVARRTGGSLLAVSLLLCILRDGGFAALLWPLLLYASSIAVTLILAFFPRGLRSATGWLDKSASASHRKTN